MLARSPVRRGACLGVCSSLIALACAPSSPLTRSRASELGASAREITLAEIQTVLGRVSTAADIVETLRPAMLVPRDRAAYSASRPGVENRGRVSVYVDNLVTRGVEALATIPARSVMHVRRMTPTEASLVYGGRHANGAISVTTFAGSRRIRREATR